MAKKDDDKDDKKDQDENDGGGKPEKLSSKRYEEELFRLQAELVKLQYWLKDSGHRVIVIFEGRDAAGKGGTIKRITERVSPRIFRTVALPAPTERELGELYGQRYIRHFPSNGEVVLFDRSWYNRAGVERVMGFCSEADCKRFLKTAPAFERMIVNGGIQLIKYWFEVSMDVQERRFQDRIKDPRKTWKLSGMDIESYRRWYDYSEARDEMLAATDSDIAPWHIVPADDKRRARLNCIMHLLNQIPYSDVEREEVELGKRDRKKAYDDKASMAGRRYIRDAF